KLFIIFHPMHREFGVIREGCDLNMYTAGHMQNKRELLIYRAPLDNTILSPPAYFRLAPNQQISPFLRYNIKIFRCQSLQDDERSVFSKHPISSNAFSF
ncbi:MAG: hypothetical protein OQJ74_07795, partial [Ignavibacteriaceae bacterium]|nr:hypothetical protein [Ignavibacteriaceae bacterium]